MLSASQITAFGSFVVLAAAGAWLVLSEFPIADPGHPTTSAGALQILEATVPSIGDFSDFNVNNQNPFIPSHARQVEIAAGSRPKSAPGTKLPSPTASTPALPALPTIASPTEAGPAVTGILLSHQGPQALITFPGDKHATVMKPGEAANGWTLVDIVGGNVVRLKDEGSGTTHDFAVPESEIESKDAPKKADGAKDAKDPQAAAKDVKSGAKDGAKSAKGAKKKPGRNEAAPGAKPGETPDEAAPAQPGDGRNHEMKPAPPLPEDAPKPPRKPTEEPRTM